jgi:hypothetical protein
MTVCLSANISTVLTERIFVTLYIGGNFMKICQESPNVVKTGKKYRPVHMIDVSMFKSLTAEPNTLQLYNTIKESHYCVSMEISTVYIVNSYVYVNNNTRDALLRFHGNNGWLTPHSVT